MSLLVPSQYTRPWRLSFFFPFGCKCRSRRRQNTVSTVAIPSCPHALSWTVLRTYVSYPSTQSPDALFSIILKPPTGVFTTTDRRFTTTDRRFTTPDRRFYTHHVGVFLFRFYLRGFPKRRLGVFLPPTGGPKHRPRFSRTPTGFQSGFSPSYTSISLVFSVPIRVASAASNHEVRLWSEADTGHNSLEIPSSNSGRLTVPNLPHVPTSCKLVTVSIIMFLLAWFVWLPCSMSGWVPRRRLYDSSALHIVGGNYTHFPPVPSIALVSLRSLRLNGCRLGSVLLSTVGGLHSVPTYISTRCSTHIPCHNMRPTGWDPLCSLPDAPFLSS